MTEFGQILRKLRKEKNWTQEELSRKSGVSKVQICLLERGKFNPSSTTLSKLMKVFNADFETFYQAVEK